MKTVTLPLEEYEELKRIKDGLDSGKDFIIEKNYNITKSSLRGFFYGKTSTEYKFCTKQEIDKKIESIVKGYEDELEKRLKRISILEREIRYIKLITVKEFRKWRKHDDLITFPLSREEYEINMCKT